MKRLIIKLLFFVLPILGWLIIEGFLPPNTYTYRPWEALKFQTVFSIRKFFHPNTTVQMKSSGELCHHTKFSTYKDELWKTDKLGNRNDAFIEDPDILIIGDSFVAGILITQDSTITNQLQNIMGESYSVYNFIPAFLTKFEYYLKNNLIQKPDLIIFSCGEKFVPWPVVEYVKPDPNSIKFRVKMALMSNSKFSNFCIYLDKVIRTYSINWAKARLANKRGTGVPGIEGSNMFFLNGKDQIYDKEDLKRTKEIILSYKKYCDSLDIDFLFLPMPNKETVYYDFVPFEKQPDYLLELDTFLVQNNVQTINTLKLYNDYRKANDKLLYHLDDTHWNSTAIRIVAKEIARKIQIGSENLASK